MATVRSEEGDEVVIEIGETLTHGAAAAAAAAVIRASTTTGVRERTEKPEPGKPSGRTSIYLVPPWIRDLNSSAYTPRFVSLGPYHHGAGHLQPMEEHKHTARFRFLRRANLENLDALKGAVDEDLLDDLMDSYQGLDEQWRNNRERFLDLMILDGCFMLEVVLLFRGDPTNNPTAAATADGYSEDNPVFGKKGAYMMPCIRRDMVLLENQLPLVLLERLAQAVRWGRQYYCNVQEMVLKFLASGQPLFLEYGPLQMALPTPSVAELILLVPRLYVDMFMNVLSAPFRLICGRRFLLKLQRIPLCSFPFTRRQEEKMQDRAVQGGGGHVLDVYKKSMLLHGDSCGGQVPFSAKQLTHFGVRFRGAQRGSFRGIDFSHRLRIESPHLRCLLLIPKPLLSLPVLSVDDDTLPAFLNLMAYERLHHGTGDEVNNYLLLMGSLIRSAEDVHALFNDGIIVCGPDQGDHEAVYELFTALVRQALPTALDVSGRTQLYSEVAAYCCSPAARTIRRLRRSKPPPFVVMLLSVLAIAVSLFAAFSNQIFQKKR